MLKKGWNKPKFTQLSVLMTEGSFDQWFGKLWAWIASFNGRCPTKEEFQNWLCENNPCCGGS